MVQASEVKMNTPVFSDVPSNHWAQSAIEWGVQQKITSGYEDGTFKPNKAVTEEEFITLLVRAYGVETPTETGQRWSDRYYRVAADKNLPVSDSRTANITRQSVANIIVGTRGVNFMGNDAVQYMLATGLTQGKTAGTIEGYKGQDTLTRAEAITFIKNVMDKVENKMMLARPIEPTPKSELPPLPVQTETTKPVVDKQIPLDSIIGAFNKAAKDLGLSEEYVLVRDTFTPNTSSKESTIYDYYAKSPDGRVLDSYAFSVFYDAKTGVFQNIQGTVNRDQADQFIKCLFVAVYQDSEKANQVYTSYKIAEVIQKAHSDKKTVDNMKLDDGFHFRYGVMGNSPQILTLKDFFSINVPNDEAQSVATAPSSKDEKSSVALPKENIIGKTNDKLAAQALQVHKAMSEMGFTAGYNGDTEGIFVRDEKGRLFLSYTDSRYKGDEYVLVINTAGLLDAYEKVVQNKLDGIIVALKTLGLPVTNELSKAMIKVLEPGVDEGTVTFGNMTIELKDNGYGKIVMYIE